MADRSGDRDLVCHNDVCLENDVSRDSADLPRRLRVVTDVYGLDSSDRTEILRVLGDSMARGSEFVSRRVEAGGPTKNSTSPPRSTDRAAVGGLQVLGGGLHAL